MKPYYRDEFATIYHGDCRDVLQLIGPCTACVTDPPYGLGFMGQGWDHGVPGEDFWKLIAGALLPGAPCLAFGGTRTYHRLACAIEDAGFELRDCLSWLYGSGFPKSLDVSKAIDKAVGITERPVVGEKRGAERLRRQAPHGDRDGGGTWGNEAGRDPYVRGAVSEAAQLWDGYGTALKPAWEPILLAMKPLDGTFAHNAIEHGVAGLNIDGTRIGTDGGGTRCTNRDGDGKCQGHSGSWKTIHGPETQSSRWPANLLLDEASAAMLDAQSGERESGSRRAGVRSGMGYNGASGDGGPSIEGSSGAASRFFYTSKASRSDRLGVTDHNDHPTVKPTSLMKWLVTLVSPPTGGVVLDPFMGSGSTVLAAKELGKHAIGIELDERYCEIAAKRMAQGVLF